MLHGISTSLKIQAVPLEPVPYKLNGRQQSLNCDGSIESDLRQGAADSGWIVDSQDLCDLARDRDKSLLKARAKLQASGRTWCEAEIGSRSVTVARCERPSQLCLNTSSTQQIIVTFEKAKAVKLEVTTVCSPLLIHEMYLTRALDSNELICLGESLTKAEHNMVALPDLG